MKGRFRLTVWIALADFFAVFSLSVFAIYLSQQVRMRQIDHVINVDRQVRTLADTLTERLRVHGINVDDTGPDMAIELPEVLLFESGKYSIRSRSSLENIAAALQDVQQVWNRNFILVVRGHTDSRPPKRFLLYRDNLELSELRARAVEKSLAASGIRPPRFQIVAQGMGDTEPHVANCRSGALIHCLSPDDYLSSGDLERNRRIELRFGVFSGNGAAETATEADQ